MSQTVGVLLFLTSCCVCSLSGLWDERYEADPDAGGVVTARSLLDQPAAAGAMVTVMASTLAGLALAGFGLGLQADRRGAATAMVVTTATTLLLLVLAGVGIWWCGASGSWGMRLWNLLLVALFAALLGFAIAARRQVRAEPPPANVDIVGPDQKIPYSWYHDDPPDVRLEREIAEKQARLDAEERELDEMRQELERKRREENA